MKINPSKKKEFKFFPHQNNLSYLGVDPKIFKSYDIRGIYPQEVNKKTAFFIGQAFGKFLKKEKPKLVVGRDNRLSSPYLFQGLIKGLLGFGARVIDIGLATTPMLYFAVANYQYDGGIQITASHNPPEYNGFKLVREKAQPISKDSGLTEIQKTIGRITQPVFQKRGVIIKKKIIEDYLDFNLKKFEVKKFKKLKIVFDTGNAVAGILIPKLKKRLPIQTISLFEKLDGKFPHHNPDPLIKENLIFLQSKVKTRKADLGVALDGDGDRICFVDERGEIIMGDLITAFLADLILKEKRGEKILYDIRSSNIVPETIKKAGGIPVVSRIGHSFIKEKMKKENILFAGEASGHFYHREHYFCEAPIFVLLKIIETISSQKRAFSELISSYRRYFQTGEINFVVKDKENILKFLEKKFAGKGKISKIDGLRVDFPDWWFLVRPSGTEDLLRLSLEAKTKKIMNKKKNELFSLILKNKQRLSA